VSTSRSKPERVVRVTRAPFIDPSQVSPIRLRKEETDAFDAFTKFLRQFGGDQPSKVAETATSVRSAKSDTVAQSRLRRGRFIIPKARKRSLTAEGLGISVAPSRGLNIVI
jgi:hypothetical protein